MLCPQVKLSVCDNMKTPERALPPCWKLFTDGMSLVGGNGFNSQTSASRQTLCSYSHASIFYASGDKLKFGKKDKISIVIALRKYKSAETSDDRAICVERYIFVVMRQLLCSTCYSRKVEWTPSRMATWPGTKTRRAPTPRWDRRNKTLWNTIKIRPKSTPLVLFSALYSMQKLWKF